VVLARIVTAIRTAKGFSARPCPAALMSTPLAAQADPRCIDAAGFDYFLIDALRTLQWLMHARKKIEMVNACILPPPPPPKDHPQTTKTTPSE